MIITAYRPLSATFPTFSSAKVTDIFQVSAYNYHPIFDQVGRFTLVVPANVPTVELITEDMILSVDNTDFLIVKDISITESLYTFTGYDLKYLLSQRVTEFPQGDVEAGTYGYDVVEGSTEYCIKHYVEYNITAAENEARRIYGFVIAENQDRGTPNDTCMSRLEPLNEPIYELCKGAGLGYSVYLDFGNDNIVFEVVEPVDKTDSQTDRNKIVFAVNFKNVLAVKRDVGISGDKNTLYTINSGGTTDPTVTVVDRDTSTAEGIRRRETVVNVSCDLAEEVPIFAKKEAEDMIATDSFEVEVNANDYGTLYQLGDKVTFKYKDLYLDSIIYEVEKNFTGDSKKVTITAGETKPKVLNSLGGKAGKAQGGVNKLNITGKAYTNAVKFNSAGFVLGFKDGGKYYENTFTTTKNAGGQITKITNTTAGRSIDVTYG